MPTYSGELVGIRDEGEKIVFEKLLREWRRLIQDYHSETKNDGLHVSNERASVSVFAGAVWKCGGWALEEWMGSKKDAWGRIDLWFRVSSIDYIAEAKQSWPSLIKSEEVNIEKVSKTLEAAEEDARKVQALEKSDYKGYRFIALAFASPWVEIEDDKEKVEEDQIQSFISAMKQRKCKSRYDFMAYTFPEDMRSFCPGDGRIYPGAALLGKFVK